MQVARGGDRGRSRNTRMAEIWTSTLRQVYSETIIFTRETTLPPRKYSQTQGLLSLVYR